MARLLAALAVVASLAGCGTQTITTDANQYSIAGPTTPLRSGERYPAGFVRHLHRSRVRFSAGGWAYGATGAACSR